MNYPSFTEGIWLGIGTGAVIVLGVVSVVMIYGSPASCVAALVQGSVYFANNI